MRGLGWIVALPVLGVLCSFTFIDLELSAEIGGWSANAPVADLCALLLLPIALVGFAFLPSPLPGWRGQILFLGASALSLLYALDTHEAAHHLLRKPLFMYLAYGLGFGWVLYRAAPPALIRWGLLVGMGFTAAISALTSLERIGAGDALWFQSLTGLTPNHKTLAVALSGASPLLFGLLLARGTSRVAARAAGFVTLLVVAAIGLSASKTAWITLALCLAWFFPAHRPFVTRWRILLPAAALGMALAYYAPVLLGSHTMLDAARSRHSLNERALHMWEAHPLVGSGTGMSVLWNESTFPHYRVNGVDAHGVIAKVASETGMLGLLGYGGFLASMGLCMRRRWREGAAENGHHPYRNAAWMALGTFSTLHTNLLFSTEMFSPTHWAPLSLAWIAAHSEEGE